MKGGECDLPVHRVLQLVSVVITERIDWQGLRSAASCLGPARWKDWLYGRLMSSFPWQRPVKCLWDCRTATGWRIILWVWCLQCVDTNGESDEPVWPVSVQFAPLKHDGMFVRDSGGESTARVSELASFLLLYQPGVSSDLLFILPTKEVVLIKHWAGTLEFTASENNEATASDLRHSDVSLSWRRHHPPRIPSLSPSGISRLGIRQNCWPSHNPPAQLS